MYTKIIRLFSSFLAIFFFCTPSVFADSLTGRVEYVNIFALSTGVDGIVEGIAAKEGERVLAGTLLLSLNSESLDAHITAREDFLKLAEAELQASTRVFEETKSLYDEGSTSRADFNLARLDVLRKTAGVSAARAALTDAEERKAKSQIVAPVAGMVVSLNVSEGQSINHSSYTAPMIVFAGNAREVVVRVEGGQEPVPSLSEEVSLSVGDVRVSGIVKTIEIRDRVTIVTISMAKQEPAFELGASVLVDF